MSWKRKGRPTANRVELFGGFKQTPAATLEYLHNRLGEEEVQSVLYSIGAKTYRYVCAGSIKTQSLDGRNLNCALKY